MTRFMPVAMSAALLCLCATIAAAQAGRSAATPFVESSAGRALERITFGAIDCVDPPACSTDPLLVNGVFVNGTYSDTRLHYGGPLGQPDVSNSLLQLILTQSQTFPSPSTASGFTFRIGAVVPVRESELYGPLFGERALTNGRGQLSLTLNANRLQFQSLDGSAILNGQGGLLWGDTNYDGAGGGYVGICRMDITSTVAYGAANFGLLDQLDVSVSVPVIHTEVTGSNEFLDFVVTGATVGPSTFEAQGRYHVTGESTGVGDIGIGAKYAFIRRAEAGAALTVRTRLPTGSLEKMTGTGETQTAIGFVGSFEKGDVSPHVNLAYTFGSGEVFDELGYTLGISYRVVPRRLNIGVELVGRQLYDVTEFTSRVQLGVLQSPSTGEFFPVRDFVAEERDVNLLLVAMGGKVRLSGRVLASVFAVLPAGESGLQVRRPTFNLGVNYAF
jgi:hypothetical protein